MGAKVCLEGLLSGEDSVTDVTLDAAGGLGALDDQGVDDIGSGAASPRLTASRVRALTRGASMATAGARCLHLARVFTPVPGVEGVVLHRGASRERHAR